MSFKQKQKLIVCIVFILVLLSLLIGYPSDVVDQNSQLHEALSEAEIIQLEGELNDAIKDLKLTREEIEASLTLTLSKEEKYAFIAFICLFIALIDQLIDG
jgi:hypothetical protein